MKTYKFYYVNYDKNEEIIGVFETIQEAILKTWKITPQDKNYKTKQSNIYHSIKTGRSINGKWYKFENE